MLSRVAESIYWMSRYVERAENVARVIDVNLQLLLDARSGPGRRELLCLSEEGTVGRLEIDVAGTSAARPG